MWRVWVRRGGVRVLVGKPKGKRPLGRPRRRWVGCGYVDWIGLAQDRDSWRTLVSAVMNLSVPWNAGNILTSCKPVSFSRRTLHHGGSKYTPELGVGSRLQDGRSRVRIPEEARSFPPKRPDRLLRSTQPPMLWVTVIFPGIKRPGHEVNQSPPYSAEVKGEWNYTAIPPVCLLGVDSENFTCFYKNLVGLMKVDTVDILCSVRL